MLTSLLLQLQEEVEQLRGVQVELEQLRSEKENKAYTHLHLQGNADQSRIRDLENRSIRENYLKIFFSKLNKTYKITAFYPG